MGGVEGSASTQRFVAKENVLILLEMRCIVEGATIGATGGVLACLGCVAMLDHQPQTF